MDIFENNPNKLELVYQIIDNCFNFSPSNIIKELNLNNSFYHKTTTYGHFGKNNLSYENIKKINEIKLYIKNNSC